MHLYQIGKRFCYGFLNFGANGSTLKRKWPGRPRTVRTPENVEAVRASIQQSPKRSARKHAMALGISSRSLRRILHTDLKLHPYKMMLAQELSERDHVNRTAMSAEILEQVPAAAVLLSNDEAHFHISGDVRKNCFLCTFQKYIRCFTTCGHHCKTGFPRSLWWKSSYKHVSYFGRLRSYGHFLILVHALVWTASYGTSWRVMYSTWWLIVCIASIFWRPDSRSSQPSGSLCCSRRWHFRKPALSTDQFKLKVISRS